MNKLENKKCHKSTGIDVADKKNDLVISSDTSISINKNYFKTLFENLKGYIEIREIANAKARTRYFNDLEELMEYEPPIDKNIYVGMMTRTRKRGKLQDTGKTRVLWLDFDDVESLIEVEFKLDMKGLPQPSMIVDSGHGYHIYYVLDEPAGREVEPVIKEMAYTLGADSKATDLARIMRVPNTMNVKNPNKPVKCQVISSSKNTFNLEELADVLGVEAKVMEKASDKAEIAAKVFDIDYQGIISKTEKPCMKAILRGVQEGERNWLLGRLTRFLKEELAVSKTKAKKIVKIWREKCDPPPPEEEVLTSFNSYWHNDKNNLLGCKILDKDGRTIPDKQQILNKYCNRSECPLKAKIEFVEGEKHIKYNNNLLNKIKDISAYSLIIYGILAMNEQGLTAERGAEIMGVKVDTFRKHANSLDYVKKKEGIARRGIKDLYYLTKKGTFRMGRTAISYAATRLLNSELKQGLIKPADIKVYMLLRYYEYKSRTGEVYPATTTLAEKLGTSRPRISTSINRLEKRDFIEIDRESKKSNLYKFKVR